MKIVCDSCSTKYSIADEKVRGKVFKIKCKKCGHIIVVKGAEGAEAAPPPAGFDQKETRVFDYSGFDGPGGSVWHLVIDREQVGPLGPQELQTKWAAGEIDGETYAWKEGMGDWLRLAAIPELAFLSGGGAPPAQATSGEAGGLFGPPDTSSQATGRADPADLFAAAAAGGEDDGGGDLFGSRAPAGDFAGAPAPLAAAPSPSVRKSVPISKDDLFSGAPSGGGGMGMAASAPESSGSKGMTGQRNENSVLFSLNNLAALASEAPKTSSSAPSPAFQSGGGSEGSGLIDIRAMAAMTLGPKKDDGGRPGASASAVDDLPVFSSNSFSAPASGVLLPSVQGRGGGSNKLIIILAALIGVLVIAGVAIVAIMLKSNKQVQAVNNTVAPVGEKPVTPEGTPAAVGTPGTPGTDKPGTPEGGTPAAGTPGTPEGGTPAAGTPEGGTPAAGIKPDEPKKPRDDKKPRDERPRDRQPDEPKKPPVEKPVKEPATSKCDEVSCAIDPSLPCCKKTGGGGGGGGGGGTKPTEAAPLGRDDIKAGMSTVKGRVAQCNDQYKTPGMVEVKIAISGDGQVTSAQVTGKFAGTPAGACVEKAVKSAKFRKSGTPMTVKYPFQFQ